MAKFTNVTTLDDAFRSLHLAVGLPDTLNGRSQAQFFLRIAVMLGWLSVEEAAKDELRTWELRGYQGENTRTLTDKVCLSAALVSHISDFHAARINQSMRDHDWRHIDEDEMRETLAQRSQIQARFEAQKQLFDVSEFKAQRSIRSDVVHRNTQKALTIVDVKKCLEYCTKLIELACGNCVQIKRSDLLYR